MLRRSRPDADLPALAILASCTLSQLLAYRLIRAEPPPAMCISSSSVIWLVSPRVLISSAPCATPRFDALLRRLAGQKSVRETRGETVAAADAVFNFQIGIRWAHRRTSRRAT